ncbi:P2Y purinoceptor 14-like [Thunnus thynnus]|uniref:P2Y purinoceptor 14-like n=1 Tax=Thunnus thynnus TaxID=8237 RepID=UPI003527EDD8
MSAAGMDHLNSAHCPTNQSSTNQSDFSSLFTKQVLPSLYFVICIVGVSLNGVAAWIFFRVPSDSGLVVYLKNMVVADLLMLFSFPFKAVTQLGLGGWRLQVIICRYTAVLFYSSMYVGILFMGLISLERYVKVVRHTPSSSCSCMSRLGGVSLQHLLQNARFARGLALLTWSLFLLCFLPNTVLTSCPASEMNWLDCKQLKTPLGLQWHKGSIIFSMVVFWVTLLVLVFCYTSIAHQIYQSYRRVQRDSSNICRKSRCSIFSILVVFFICFVPYHVCRVPFTVMKESHLSQTSRYLLFQLKEGTVFLSALNVCLDPIIYFLMCGTFRESLLRKLSRKKRRRRIQTTAVTLSKT